MTFWQVFVAFGLLSSMFVLWPFFKRWRGYKRGLRTDIRSDARDATIEDRALELESALHLGEIDSEQFENLTRDLQQTRQAQAAHQTPMTERAVTLGHRSRWCMVIAALFIPVFSYALYSQQGAKVDWDITTQMQKFARLDRNELDDAALKKVKLELKELQKQISQRLISTEDNGNLWYLLADVSTQLSDYEETVRAFRYLNAEYPESAKISAELAQALFLRAGNVITPEVRENYQAALEFDREESTALGLAGIDAFQQKQYDAAIKYWNATLKQLDPEAPDAKAIREAVVLAKALGGTKSKEAAARPRVRVEVSLADDVPPPGEQDTLFVYARAWQGARVPLAIQKLTAKEFPVRVSLDQSMAMVQDLDITTAAQLEIVARISKSGEAVPQSGDWIGSTGPVRPSKQNKVVKVEINTKNP